MLKKIVIKNYAILEEVEVEFGQGLNILTGETGTGKSIIIGALSLLLGGKADVDFIRKGEKKAIVEGYFEIKKNEEIRKILKQEVFGIPDELLLRREVYLSGRNRAFVNDNVVNLATLKEISKYLIDIHGQHQYQSLVYENSYINIIDEYGGILKLANTVYDSYFKLSKIRNSYIELCNKKTELEEQTDFYKFQLREINKVNPQLGEDEALEKEIVLLENKEKIREYIHLCYDFLYDSEGSAAEKIKTAMKHLEELSKIEPEFASFLKDLESAYIGVKETGNYIRDFGEKIEYSQEHLEGLRERLLTLNSLKRKYKGTIQDILDKRNELEEKLNVVTNIDQEIKEISDALKKETEGYRKSCLVLSEKRKKIAKDLRKIVFGYLQKLGMEKSLFEVSLDYREDVNGIIEIDGIKYFSDEHGIDIIDLLISPGKSENLKPISKIASGGELSRIMLAIKSVLAEVDHIPVLIFDEIDSGISGRIATAVGKELKNLALYHQILCVTHLPQIASMAYCHFRVEKMEERGRVVTQVECLEADERTKEIARLISGEKISKESLKTAEKLIDEGMN